MMRRLAGLFTLIIASFAPPALAQQPPSPPTPAVPAALRSIVPGKSLAGIAIGARIPLVLARFGRPSDTRETATDTVYTFNRVGIAVYASGGKVTAISTSNSLLKIEPSAGDEGLGVGFRREVVVAAFGREFRDGTVEGWPGLIYDERGIAFGLDRRAVAAILVFRAGTAASISGLIAGRTALPMLAGFPSIAGRQPWSPSTNFMSLPGYLRSLVHQTSRIWISPTQSARVVREQLAAPR